MEVVLILGLVVGVFVVFAAFIGGIVYVAMHFARQRARERDAIWSAWAQARGGSLVPGRTGFLTQRSSSIVVPHGHASVAIDTYVVSHGKTSTTYTRARSRFALGFGPSFQVSSEGILSAVGKALGAQDLQLDDPAFDARFVIKGESTAAIAVAWTPRARRAALFFERPNVRSDGAEVMATVVGVVVLSDQLDALAAIAGEVASYRVAELAELARAADATFHATSGAPPMLRFATNQGEVMSGLSREGLTMKLADARGLPLELRATLVGGEAQGLPRGLLSDEGAALLPRVGNCQIATGDGFVWLTWPGVPDGPTFRAGALLLAELAGGDSSRGAFR